MPVNLNPSQEQLVRRAIAAGLGQTVEEVIDLGLRSLEQRLREEVPVTERPDFALRKIGGLWVHHGTPEPGVDWNRVVDDVREERMAAIAGVSAS